MKTYQLYCQSFQLDLIKILRYPFPHHTFFVFLQIPQIFYPLPSSTPPASPPSPPPLSPPSSSLSCSHCHLSVDFHSHLPWLHAQFLFLFQAQHLAQLLVPTSIWALLLLQICPPYLKFRFLEYSL